MAGSAQLTIAQLSPAQILLVCHNTVLYARPWHALYFNHFSALLQGEKQRLALAQEAAAKAVQDAKEAHSTASAERKRSCLFCHVQPVYSSVVVHDHLKSALLSGWLKLCNSDQ